ncbi:3-carboxy-cis,cis-muconate cycloisomerase [Nocardioides lentus]|uniref:3-carboxy-cis,cis-muconate cycloisomerase n=1 Tax=Nocardioides lentus TaxID=338077 RepID=A0ABN2NYB0_9ACTN
MSGLLWPGDERAAGVLDDAAVLAAMVAVEAAWLAGLVEAGVAPAGATAHPADLSGLVGPDDLADLAAAAESGGTPVLPLVALLRDRLRDRGAHEAARWLHRGLTSQDVVDTALVLGARDALDAVTAHQRRQLTLLAELAEAHTATPAVARTLTQHAVPTTFGVRVAGWLTGVLDATRRVRDARAGLRVQLGGAAGTLAAAVELAGDADVVRALADATAARLGLAPAPPWHTVRGPVAVVGDALVAATDAWGHLAADVLSLTRSEVGEVAEGAGGGSSTMPHKANPVLSVLLRRAALAAPGLGATLHLAAATAVDERSDGAWHVEWETLALLARRTVVAAGQATDLLGGLRVDVDRMAANLAAADGVDAEQRAMADLAGRPPAASYDGLASWIVSSAVTDARHHLTEESA